MKKFKKLTATVVSLMMVCTSMEGFTLWSSADDENVALDLTSVKSLALSTNNNGETTYTLNGETKVYTGQIILEGTSENGFTVENGTHDIVFNNVTINDSVVIKPNAIANIEIYGTNTVKAKPKIIENSFLWFDDKDGKAGINVPEGATLNLSGSGNGELTTTGSDNKSSNTKKGGAGIGGNTEENAGTIYISENVTVNATGGEYAAGIGGGYNGNGGNINISGGTVTAISELYGAGIGGGKNGNGGKITITGGKVTATGEFYAAAIGGGEDGNGGNINISGGTVNATSECWAAGIGGGVSGNSGNISISGGNVTAEGGSHAAGIGGGSRGSTCFSWLGHSGDGENITISGGTVKATGGENGAGIGGGDNGDSGNISISDGDVTATGGKNAAGIGGGSDGEGTEITISGGAVNATGGENGAGIGGGKIGDSGKISITGGNLTVTGGKYGAGIGGGSGENGMDGECIEISVDFRKNENAVLKVKSGQKAEVIGGGYDELGSGTVTVNGVVWDSEIRNKYYGLLVEIEGQNITVK